MTQAPSDGLRDLVAAMVRDVVTEMVATSVQDLRRIPGAAPAPMTTSQAAHPPSATGVRGRAESVRIESDADLDSFVRHLLQLFENPKNRQDIRAGRHAFKLAPPAATPPPPGVSGGSQPPARRIERGAVTERHIKTIAEAGQRLVLGRAAVLTPLARDCARSLGVAIEKEHR